MLFIVFVVGEEGYVVDGDGYGVVFVVEVVDVVGGVEVGGYLGFFGCF